MGEPQAPVRPRVVVIGAGFAGLNAVQRLGFMPVDVTVIDRANHHKFQPLLYQVALAVLSPADIAQPIRAIFSGFHNVEVLLDEVVGGDVAAKTLKLATGAEVEYDYLLLGTGSTQSYFGHDEWEKLAPGLKTIEDALEIRRRVLLSFELAERDTVETGKPPQMNFVVIGGGPTGVELAGAIRDITRLHMQRDFRHIDPTKARVILIEGAPRLLTAYPEDLSESAARQLRDLGVEVRCSEHVTDVQPGYVMIGSERIDAAVTLWAAGVIASPLGKILGLPTDRRGCVLVDDHLNPAGHPEIFVMGDLAHFEQNGAPVPGVAQPAMQMGKFAANAIAADLAGKPRKKFHYFDKGDMATIGRKAAVARIVWPFKAHWSGVPAWLTWLTVHIYFLVGFRSRLVVFWAWMWTYFTATNGARLITGSQMLPGWTDGGTVQMEAGRPVKLDAGSPAAEAPVVGVEK